MAIVQDLSERKSLEQNLHRTRDLLELAVRSSHLGIFEFDLPEGRIETSRYTLINFWEMLGYDPAEAPTEYGAAAALVFTPEDLERVPSETNAYLSGAIPRFELESQLRKKDGSLEWRLTRGVAVRDERGTPTRLIGSFVDITDRKELERELRHAKERLELAIRSSNLSIWEYDMPDGVIDVARQTLINVWEPLGYDVADAPLAIHTIMHPDDLARVSEQTRSYLTGESKVFEVEHRVRQKDGAYRWLLDRGVALRDADGKAFRFVGTSIDINDLKRIECELDRAREAAETANRAKDEFLANVSHEIRTPMNAILGMTELALDNAPTDHQRQLLTTVKSAAKNLLGIINDLLDFSKIAAGMLTLDQADFSLRVELGDAVRALATRAHRKGLELICDVHADVPDLLFGDAGRLRQVLMNLVDNAIKFTARGEVVVEVTGAGDQEPGGGTVALVFAVRDTGIGIAPEKQADIFRAFEQADSSTTRKYGGTGLGLTISAQLAALMDGEITLQSEPERGARSSSGLDSRALRDLTSLTRVVTGAARGAPRTRRRRQQNESRDPERMVDELANASRDRRRCRVGDRGALSRRGERSALFTRTARWAYAGCRRCLPRRSDCEALRSVDQEDHPAQLR